MLAAILAGGLGKRLRPYTEDCPKPMVPVAGKPLLEWQILWLRKHNVREILLLVGYKKEKIIEHFGSGSKFDVRITYVVEDEPLGTGGALKNSEHVLSKNEVFLVLNGDILTDLNPLLLVEKLSTSSKYLGVIATIPLPSPYGILELNGEDVKGFVEKPVIKDYWINAGVYALKREALKYFPERGDLERTSFPAMARDGVLGAVKYVNVRWKSIDTYKDLEEAGKIVEEALTRN